jgi:hypothetical protein
MKIYGDSTGSFPNGALQLNDGYVIYGIKGSYGDNAPIYFMKTDLNGITSCKWSSVTLPDSTFSMTPSDTGTTANIQGTMTVDYTELVKDVNEVDDCENTSISFIPSSLFSVRTFPNPFHNEFELTIKMESSKQVLIAIQNIYGQTLFKEQELNSTLRKIIDLRGQPNGIYFLNLTIDKERVVKKLLKQ